jgi:outer membrane protein OmpU
MKKALFSTTALAAAGALAFGASDALAQSKAKPLSMSVGGYFNSFVGYSEQSSSFESSASSTARVGYDQFNVINDSEVYFRGSTKLDNGLGVSLTVQLETDQVTNGTQMDESYMTLKGGFGSVLLGSTKGSTVKLNVGAPGVGGLGLSNVDHDSWIIKPSAVGNTVNFGSGTTAGASDSMKVVYLSPTIAGGLSVGASYTPSTTNADNMPVTGGNSGTESQMFDAVVKYSAKMGGSTVSANVGYGETQGTAANSNKFVRTGVAVSSGGVTAGFDYKDVQDDDSGKGGTANSDEQQSYNIGVKYAAGGYTMGVAYAHTEMPFASGTTGDDEMDKYILGLERGMGAGVTLTGQLLYVDYSDETTSDANNNNGWALVGGVKVAF